MKKILVILLLILNSCGYQPLYSKKDIGKFNAKEFNFLGDKDINKYLISSLQIKVDKENYEYKKILIENNKKIIETSKDSKGKPDSLKMIIVIKFLFENKNNILTEKTISKEFSYKNKDNKFDLSLYEDDIEKNLIDSIVDELTIFINL